jgi:AcrR family transcriptional regulator
METMCRVDHHIFVGITGEALPVYSGMETVKRGLRADAWRNRRRILDAAREAMLEHGPDVPLDEIARRAGVGNATVYRRFSDRQALILQVVLDTTTALTAEAESALAEEPDAYQALRRFVHRAADLRVGAVFPLLTEVTKSEEFFESRDQFAQMIDRIMGEAIASGLLRPDVALGDLMVGLTQLTRPLPGKDRADADRFAHRHLELLLDGMRAPQRSQLPGPVYSLADFHRACAQQQKN